MKFWVSQLDGLLRGLIRIGMLEIGWPDGTESRYGKQGPAIRIDIHDRSTPRRLLLRPELAIGEAYMWGHLTIRDDDLRGLLALLAGNARARQFGRFKTILPALSRATRRITQANGLTRARHNVEHHYDLSVDLYELFLDEDLQYTCGYFPRPGMTLEEAQEAKKAHIAKKLLIEPGMKVMDIGCGWGGMAITLARDFGARVVGVSLSKVQLAHAARRAEAAGLADRIEWRLVDYRAVREEFDRIVVVGMLEHVGLPNYPTFFDRIRRNLGPDGIALVHTIGRATPPGLTAPFIDKYIFPGCYTPSLSEVMRDVERSNLIATDIEVWRMHYVHTLRAWQDRFETNRDAIRDLHDDCFVRMWRYYLVASEVGFTHLANEVFQIQLTRHQEAAPLTRDYMCADPMGGGPNFQKFGG